MLQVSPSFFPFSSTINILPRICLFFIASTFCSSSASPTSPHFISFLLLTVRYLFFFFLLFTSRESQSPSAKTIITSLAMQLASMLILQKGANPTAQRNPIILCKASLGPSGAALIYTRVTPQNWCREKKKQKKQQPMALIEVQSWKRPESWVWEISGEKKKRSKLFLRWWLNREPRRGRGSPPA